MKSNDILPDNSLEARVKRAREGIAAVLKAESLAMYPDIVMQDTTAMQNTGAGVGKTI